MPGCCAFACKNRDSKGFLMKRFPRDPERRKQWEIKVSRANWKPTNSSYLCEAHFSSGMFEQKRADGKRKLKANAVPTIFAHIPLQKQEKLPLTISCSKKKHISEDPHTLTVPAASKASISTSILHSETPGDDTSVLQGETSDNELIIVIIIDNNSSGNTNR